MSNKLTESKEETNEHNDSFNVIEQGSSDRNKNEQKTNSSIDSLEIIDQNDPSSTNRQKDNKKEEISMKQIFVSVFLYYSTFSSEEKDFVISQVDVIKMLKDLKLISNSSKKGVRDYEIDILFKKVRKIGKILVSREFLNLLVLISEKVYHSDFVSNPQNAIAKLNKNHIEPYYKYLINPDSKINKNSIFIFHRNMEMKIKKSKFDANILLIYNDIYNSIKTVYALYFLTEIANQNNIDVIIKNSLNNLIEFAKEFEITPYFIELNKIVIMYHLILEMTPTDITKYKYNEGNIFDDMKNIGKVFTLSKFCMILFHFSLLIFDKLNKSLTKEQFESVSDSEKLLLFLDKLNQGKGVIHLRKKFGYNPNNPISLIPSKEIIDNINIVIIERNKIIGKKDTIKSINDPNSNDDYINYERYLKIKNDEIMMTYENNIEEIKSIFEEFSSIGEKFGNRQMNLTGYIRFLYRIGVIKEKKKKLNKVMSSPSIRTTHRKLDTKQSQKSKLFNENEGTLIYNKVLYNTKQKYLIFGTFLQSFELLSQKLYESLSISNEEKLNKFIETYCYSIIDIKKKEGNKKDNILQLLSYVKEGVIYSVINDMKKILYSIFSTYSDQNDFLNFSSFYQLYKDFSLFPDIVNLVQIKFIFYSLSDLFKEQIIKQIKDCKDLSRTSLLNINPFLNDYYINFEIFCEALGLITFYIKESDKNSNNDVMKIYTIFVKMSQKSIDDNKIKNASLRCSPVKKFNIALEAIKRKYIDDIEKENILIKYKNVLNSPTSFDDICSNK